VLLDRHGEPAAHVLAWHDRSGEAAEALLRATFGDGDFSRRTGQPLARRLSAIKVRHLRDQLGGPPGADRWLSVPEWVVHGLGGAPITELSLGSRTGFVDIATGGWCEEILDWAGLPAAGLAPPVRAGTPAGTVSARSTELHRATLTVAGHDHVCAAVGAGATGAGDVFDSWGNGEGVLRRVDALPDVDHVIADGTSISWHAGPAGRVLIRGLGSGLIHRHVLASLGTRDRAALDAMAATVAPLDELPLDAAGAPDLGAIDPGADPARIWRAALELTFARVRDSIRRYETFCGPTARILGAGGWLRSAPLAALKAAAVPGFQATPIREPGAHGAALLAGVAAGLLDAPVPASDRRTGAVAP
jgi:sugar (pentulose or hexulose) kinase